MNSAQTSPTCICKVDVCLLICHHSLKISCSRCSFGSNQAEMVENCQVQIEICVSPVGEGRTTTAKILQIIKRLNLYNFFKIFIQHQVQTLSVLRILILSEVLFAETVANVVPLTACENTQPVRCQLVCWTNSTNFYQYDEFDK